MRVSNWAGAAVYTQCGYTVKWLSGYEPEDKWCTKCHEPLQVLAPCSVNLPQVVRED